MPVYPVIDQDTGKQKRKAGKLAWIVSIYVAGMRRYQRRHYGTKTDVARQEARKHEELLERAGVFPNSQKKNPTFGEFGEWWIEHIVVPKKGNVRTIRARLTNISRWLEQTQQGGKRLSQFTTEDVYDFMDWRRNDPDRKKPPSEVTIKRDVVQWRTMMRFAVKRQDFVLNHDITEPIELVHEEPKFQEGMTIEQYYQIYDAAVDYLKPVIKFAAFTAWRKMEILKLTLRRLDLNDLDPVAIIEAGPKKSKGKVERISPLPREVVEMLKSLDTWGTCTRCNRKEHHQDSQCQRVFTRNGKPMVGVRKALINAYEEAGLMRIYDVAKPLHRFRNFWRTNQAMIGTDPLQAMKAGGWKDPKMYMRYLERRKDINRGMTDDYSNLMRDQQATIIPLQKAENSDA
jgi:integrase